MPNDCYDCALAELAWIGQREQALSERGYEAKEAHRLASAWAKCRRRGMEYPSDVQRARELLDRELFTH